MRRLVDAIHQGPERTAGAVRVGRWHEPAGQVDVQEQDREAAEQRRREQPDLGAQARPEDGIETDALVPERVGPEVQPEAEEQEDEQEDEPDDPPGHAPAATARTLIANDPRPARWAWLTGR